MPFILQERRNRINDGALGICGLQTIEPGDLCYVHYKRMVDQWRENPRWTTAHNIRSNMFFGSEDGNEIHAGNDTKDDFIAKELAWEVFFQLEVIPYEILKRDANGDI